MQIPLQISLHGVERSDALYNAIHDKTAKLERYSDRIMSCRVVLERDARHKHKGGPFTVRIDMKVPGREIAVTREHGADVQIALRDAFDAARRQLEDQVREQRGDVKQHAPEFTGRVARLDAEQGIGFIVTDDGREYYFSRDNVVAPSFDRLAVGTPVHFIEEVAGEGLQAKRVSARHASA
jgi:ribosomal subunit interface protein